MLDSKVSDACTPEQLELHPKNTTLPRVQNPAAWLAMLEALENEFREVLRPKAPAAN